MTRDGYPITTDRRRFLDLRKKEVTDYLEQKVIAFLKEHGFGYLKVDYNDNIGMGCDGDRSLGEGLRQQVLASHALFEKIREECPDLVIENCASGGHRLDPSMLALTDMSSISDAHECVSIPKIAANVLRAVPAAQSQIWAVLRKTDDEKRLHYTMANTFLGRMCLSGDVTELSELQWSIVDEGIEFYRECSSCIKYGNIRWYGETGASYAYLTGWQAVTFSWEDRLLLVVHKFQEGPNIIAVELPENWGELQIQKIFARRQVSVKTEKAAEGHAAVIRLKEMEELEAAAVLLKK